MSRPDRAPRIAVDFAPPVRRGRRTPVVGLVVAIVLLAVLAIAVTQLLLR